MPKLIKYRRGFRGCLVLQVKDKQWRDARLKDLLFENPSNIRMSDGDVLALAEMFRQASELFPGKTFEEILMLALKGQNDKA